MSPSCVAFQMRFEYYQTIGGVKMNVFSFIFSPTGGTKKVADIVASCFLGDHQSIDLTRPVDFMMTLTETDIAILAVPSFGGRVPAVALERLRQIKAERTRAVLLVSFGNRAIDDAMIELYDEAGKIGFLPFAGIAAVTEHSIFREYGKNRPDESDKRQLTEFALKIKDALDSGCSCFSDLVPGNRPYKEFGGVPLKPKAGKACTKCRTCAMSCPVNAIPLENPQFTDAKRCISCMRCISVCPEQARSLNSLLYKSARLMMNKALCEHKDNKLYL